MRGSNKTYQDIIRMSYAYFKDRMCTPDTLAEFLDRMNPWLTEADINRDDVYAELERRHTVTMLDSSSILEDHDNHEEWFNPSINNGLKRDIEWHFWSHYEGYLTSGKGWPREVVGSIDRESSAVLARLEDPSRPGAWDRRGMVIGSVQSGKTANYTGLICKAIDAGYRLIVILAGVHNSLRSQTQYRLNEEILGYDLDKVQEFYGQAASIGVRAMFKGHKIAQTLTSSNEKGDFRKFIADQAGMIPSPDGPPIIMIIKKHVSILKNLNEWATSIVGQMDDSGRRVVADVPLLVIDDECDYASVNTKKVVVDEDGLVNEECDPAKTNMRIRELLNSFRKSAYVGYTATPFANIFIHHDQRHTVFGEDLFPRNFIINLSQPTNYIGPEQVFGLVEHLTAGIAERDQSMLVRFVEDSDDIIPGRHNKELEVDQLPASLEEAIRSFLISCAIRRFRGSLPHHNSMLVHVTRFTYVQMQVQILVERILRGYVDRIRSKSDPLDDFRSLFLNDFSPTSNAMVDGSDAMPDWPKVVENLYPVAQRIRILLINGTSADALLYRHMEYTTRQRIQRGETVPWEEQGEHVIAIGGDKLARGLTLDGLTVSYYLRASKMYDTLMQMGRWFGYRDGYSDLCRIYTTQELAGWYRFIASASVELRQELDYMALIKAEPKDFGLKVLDHPGQLAITSAGKRRNAETLSLSYSGRISETVVFDLRYSAHNLQALADLLKEVEADGEPGLTHHKTGLHWKNVRYESVVRYLRRYRTLEEAARVVDPLKIAQFIEQQQNPGSMDLKTWDVALLSRQDSPPHTFELPGYKIGCFERKAQSLSADTLTIGRLVNPPDEWIDFDVTGKDRVRKKWEILRAEQGKEPPDATQLPSGPAIRALRPKECGLLLIYPICSKNSETPYGRVKGQEVTGFAISFPASDTTHQIQYQVNSVFQDAED